MTGSPPLIVCEHVTLAYAPDVLAVRDVTTSIDAGARVALTGPSGSGKSTLLHLMAGLLTPTDGRVHRPGLTAPDAEPNETVGTPCPGVAVVFQGPSLLPELSVTENVALPLLFAGAPAGEDTTARAGAALAATGVGDLAERVPDELSGGQAQRVAIARALAGRPRVILADEPTGALDRETGRRVVTTLLDVADELGAALVIATHDAEVADRLEDRWPMRDGALLAGPHCPAADRTDLSRPGGPS